MKSAIGKWNIGVGLWVMASFMIYGVILPLPARAHADVKPCPTSSQGVRLMPAWGARVMGPNRR